MPRNTALHIDLAAIGDNVAVLRKKLGNRAFMAVIKADAYGHGAAAVATHIEHQVDAFAVAFTEEAASLRQTGIRKPILVLEGPHTPSDMAAAIELDLWPVLHEPNQLEWLKNQAKTLRSVWLKADTGMHRLGFAHTELPSVRDSLKALGVNNVLAMTHLASAEQPEDSLTLSQLAHWHNTATNWPDQTSLCNSAGALMNYSASCDWARVGYAIYGGKIENTDTIHLKPAMHFASSVIALRHIRQGDSVGYSGRWVAPRDSVIATVPAGYGDGYPRTAKDGTPVAINGQLAPLAGTVSMDMLTVDVTDCSGVELGAAATLWGNSPAVDAVAPHAETIGYELMTRVTGRPKRLYYTETAALPLTISGVVND
jgi:alanine racemase